MRWVAAALLCLLSYAAQAACSPTPFVFTDGTQMRASQVKPWATWAMAMREVRVLPP